MKTKTSIRYVGFRSTKEGGRLFDFNVSGPAVAEFMTSFEIPAQFFTGIDRLRLQEGVGICYAKLQQLLQTSLLTEVPAELCLTAVDLNQYREVAPTPYKRKPPSDVTDGKIG